ncbi:MAG: hypothetical protein OEO21_02950 [Candidatus Krumholzibacteria bacterium]|nr:hypothetical protein [Candidatus Krumholzibacteria bacterium]
MKRTVATPLATLALTFASLAAAEDFSKHWHDGKAELSGYALEVSRYGQTRKGTAVMIYVTEPFSDAKRVKVDDHTRNPADVVDVLKLNLVRDFQTGIYDYNTLVSVFSRTSDLAPLKVSFSSAEWCGHVYSEMRFDRRRVSGTYHSYFEGESGQIALDAPKGGVSEDNLFILVRGLRGEFLAPGASRTVPYLPGVFYSRLSHQPPRWTQATITRAAEAQTVAVPAGTFATMLYDVRGGDGRTGQFWVEEAWPHRIVKWSLPPDLSGELLGTKRLAYWKLNGEGGERHLAEIGLGK